MIPRKNGVHQQMGHWNNHLLRFDLSRPRHISSIAQAFSWLAGLAKPLLILQQVEGNLIYPRVVGSKINLPAIWVLTAVTLGGSLMGIPGILLRVPPASALHRLIVEVADRFQTKEYVT